MNLELIQGCRIRGVAFSHRLSEVEWRILRVLLPVEREPGKRGRTPPEDNRKVINGVLWRLRTGAPWRDVPEKYGNWNTILPALPAMERLRCLESVAVALAETMAESGHYNIDSTTVRLMPRPQAEKGLINELLAARGAGSPVEPIASVMPEIGRSPSTSRPVKRQTVRPTTRLINLPEQPPEALLADKAYDTDAIREDLK